jgi:hypothetical protein
VGFGKSYPEFWSNARPLMTEVPLDSGNYIRLRAPDEAAVIEFHAIALKFGCRSAGAPGVRQAAKTSYHRLHLRFRRQQDRSGYVSQEHLISHLSRWTDRHRNASDRQYGDG